MPERLSMQAALEVLDTRILDVIKHLDAMPPVKLWERFRSLFADLRYAHETDDQVEASALIRQLQALIERGGAESAAWVDLRGMFLERARIVESERRLLIDAKQYVTKERAMIMLTRVMGVIERHVTDPRVMGAIAEDFSALANTPSTDDRQPEPG